VIEIKGHAPGAGLNAAALRRDASLVALGSAAIVAALIFVLHPWWFTISPDWSIYMNAAQRWLATGAYFLPRQLDGPYQVAFGDVLYPPTALWLFVPFSYLPRLAWFVIPAATIVASLWRLRPALWGWAVMGVLFVLQPVAILELTAGNPLVWMLAALFASVAFETPAVFLLLKPTLLPFALFGVWRRSWWLGLGLLALLSVPFTALELTWLRVMLDSREPLGLLYSLPEWPMMAIPLVAWASSSRREDGPFARRRPHSRP
jgi:hypothetical protein